MEGVRIRVAIKPPRPALQKREGAGGSPAGPRAPRPSSGRAGLRLPARPAQSAAGQKRRNSPGLGQGLRLPPLLSLFFFFLFPPSHPIPHS